MINANSPPEKPKRIGVFGGAFDPLHKGHLAVAEAAREQLKLHQVILIPTFVPPHKSSTQYTYENRLAMAHAVACHESWLQVSDLESKLPAPSYTLQTLVALKSQQPTAEFTLILGEDAFNSLPTWFSWQKLVTLCKIAIFARHTGKPTMKTDLDAYWLQGPLWPVSSTDIRQRQAQGLPVDDLVPNAVLPWLTQKANS